MSDRSDPNESPARSTEREAGESPGELPDMSPAFLTRLGQAASGFPEERYWWTAHLKPADGKFRPKKHPTQTAAADEVKHDPTRGALGPVVAPKNPGGTVRTKVTQITIEFEDGPPRVLSGKEYDAVFWGYPAVRKFVIPYYVGVAGLEYGMRIHTEAQEGDMILAHSPDTEYRIYRQPPGRKSEPGEPLELLL